MAGKTGDLFEINSELEIEWRINFSSLSEEDSKTYESPDFYFSGASFHLLMYPNGEKHNNSNGKISLYLMRNSTGHPLHLDYTLGLKTVDGKKNPNIRASHIFAKKNCGRGPPELISRSALLERKSEFLPSDVLTVTCKLRNDNLNSVSSSYFRRLQDVSDNMKDIYLKAKGADVVLNVEGQKIKAHRMILESRSTVFEAMFSHDMKENQTGEVDIEDTDRVPFESVLFYMYTGDIGKLTPQNALEIYAVADKYYIKDVKEMCTAFIERNLSPEWVCDVIKFSSLFQEQEIARQARAYFQENAAKVLESDQWQTFSKENQEISMELLASVVKLLSAK